MPFKSKAQQRWMYAAEDRGEVPEGTADEWAEETDFDEIPEKVKKKKEKRAHVKRAEEIALEILEKAAAARGGMYNALHNQYHKLSPLPSTEARRTSVTSFPRNAIKPVTTAPNMGLPTIPAKKTDTPSSSLMTPPSVPATPMPKALKPPKPTKPPEPKTKETVHTTKAPASPSTTSAPTSK